VAITMTTVTIAATISIMPNREMMTLEPANSGQ
jgi:hypothetical protein